ncbi:NUMOD4 domain-containing protein [Paenibacillus sp. 1P03SA]|uniref:NUMOD4 domain-containing protein n=1 Tax=Paenibacillus sp. 1P03SA TaxID=3132294 RepID=UPI0039A17687
MDEEMKDIPGYEGLYAVTESGRIYSHSKKNFKIRNGSPYGFKHVHLYKAGKKKLFKTGLLWESLFKNLPKIAYKGM